MTNDLRKLLETMVPLIKIRPDHILGQNLKNQQLQLLSKENFSDHLFQNL